MKQQLAQYQEKWQQLEPRERNLISVMLAVCGVALFYFAIWSPLHQGIADAEQGIETQRKNLIWMQRSVGQLIQAKEQVSSSQRKVSGSLSQRVNSTANKHEIKLSRIQPQKSDLSVRIESVEFNKLLDWFHDMEKQGIQAVSVDLSKADQAGRVEVRKLLLRSES